MSPISMSPLQRATFGLRCKQRGLSLVEAVLSVLLVGGLLVAALNTLGSSQRNDRLRHTLQQGQQLVQDMLAEVRLSEHASGLTVDGSAAATGQTINGWGTVQANNRLAFDTPMDYHGWSANPPVDRLGIAVPQAKRLTRNVTVTMHLADRTETTDADAAVLCKVVVQVLDGNKPIAEATDWVPMRSSDPILASQDAWERGQP